MDSVTEHYRVAALEERILAALEEAGKSRDDLVLEDLAPVDGFHMRGRAATEELARLAALDEDARVLDVGCGIGGTCRYLATTFGCITTGLDLTPDYVETARALSARVGLSDETTFHEGSALSLPFQDRSYDAVWTEHVQMNIADKTTFYREIARVLDAEGRFLFHDIFAGDGGDGGDVRFPVPWAASPDISHLVRASEVRAKLWNLGYRELHWQDTTTASIEWLEAVVDNNAARGERRAVGAHLLMGESASTKLENVAENLRQGRVTVIQAVLTRG